MPSGPSGRFFEVLGVPAVLGRTFAAADDQASGGPDGPVTVISYGLWQRVFGGAATTLGETLEIDRVRFTIVGVTPPDFFGLDVGHSVDLMFPLETEPLLRRLPARTGTWPWLHITARLRPGETLASATAAMRAVQPQIRRNTIPDYLRTEDREAYLQAPWTMRSAATGSSSLRERYSTALFTLLAIVGTVLLVACANVANLQLARTAGRRYEFGVRAALGASRARIARQQLVECLLMSAIGTVLGLVFAQWVGRLIVAQLSTWAATAFLDLTPDWRILAAITVVMILTTVIFGTAPAFRASRADPIEALNRHRRGAVGGASMGLTDGIVVVQVGLSLLLVVGASMFLRSFFMLVTRDLGFDRSGVLVAVIDGRRSSVAPGGRLAFYERLRDAAAALPGVETRGAVHGDTARKRRCSVYAKRVDSGQSRRQRTEDSGRARVARLVRDVRHAPPGRPRFQLARPRGVRPGRDRQRGICAAISQRRAADRADHPGRAGPSRSSSSGDRGARARCGVHVRSRPHCTDALPIVCSNRR